MDEQPSQGPSTVKKDAPAKGKGRGRGRPPVKGLNKNNSGHPLIKAMYKDTVKGYVNNKAFQLLDIETRNKTFFNSYQAKDLPIDHATFEREERKNPPHLPSMDLLEGLNGLATEYMEENPESKAALADSFSMRSLLCLGMLVEEVVKNNLTGFEDKFMDATQKTDTLLATTADAPDISEEEVMDEDDAQ
ncbi:hypothetical protein BC940DRAFT_296515 [Gongronella butleri]|nr:hypothetical protein BC940DRAFT_296515 [Gongronella butleri]